MSCLAIICLSNLFVRVEAGYQDQPTPISETRWHLYDRNFGSPYLGGFAVGFENDYSPHWQSALYYRHESQPTLPDKGVDALWFTVTYRPFAGRSW